MSKLTDQSTDPAVIQIVVNGPFAVCDSDGVELTPRAQKSRALLALLALSPEYRRSRRWIEERLWSDRAPGQASGSLRQALVDLRKSLGDLADIVEADREWIGLAPGSFTLSGAGAGAEDFLEGINVRDPAFEQWRDTQQIASSPARTPHRLLSPVEQVATDPVVIRWGTASLPGTGSAMVAEIVAARIASDISEQVSSWTTAVAKDQLQPSTTPDLDVTCNVIEDNGICLAFIKIIHVESGRVLFARDCRLIGTATSLIESEQLVRTAYEAAEKAVGHIPHVLGVARAETKSTALGQLALHKMFTFDEKQLVEADALLSKAYELDESGVFLAWRGLLQMITSIEQSRTQSSELRDMAEALGSYAMEQSPGNAMVHALVAQTQALLFGNADAAMTAAARATDQNPRNPLAIQSMAIAKVLAGDDEEAYRLSAKARSFAKQSVFRHWWDAQHCTICAATGRIDEAISSAEAALAVVPSQRPSYRNLIALFARRGDLDKAILMKERLQRMEPGFTLDRMLNDPEYPVRTLRRTGLLEDVKKLV